MNYGEEDIKKLRARITIYGATYETIGVVETEEVSLDAKGQVKLKAIWEPTGKFGKYKAVAEVMYDDKDRKSDV